MQEWSHYRDINTRLACPIIGFTGADAYPRKKTRTMGSVSRMATYATERALSDAGLTDDPVLHSGRTGIAYGSSFGSPQPYVAFAELMTDGTSRKLNATSYIQMMSHTASFASAPLLIPSLLTLLTLALSFAVMQSARE